MELHNEMGLNRVKSPDSKYLSCIKTQSMIRNTKENYLKSNINMCIYA